MENNYPIKYAVLELKERGGYPVGYEDITQGFIASKCFVIESDIIYKADGSNKIIHKVVFPFSDIAGFNNSIRNGGHNIGKMEVPRYDACGKIYPISIVSDLFDSYEEAKIAAVIKNNEYKDNILFNVPASIGVRISNADWNRQSEVLKQQFDRTLEVCNIFEKLVFLETMNMEISGELAINKQRALKPKCK